MFAFSVLAAAPRWRDYDVRVAAAKLKLVLPTPASSAPSLFRWLLHRYGFARIETKKPSGVLFGLVWKGTEQKDQQA